MRAAPDRADVLREERDKLLSKAGRIFREVQLVGRDMNPIERETWRSLVDRAHAFNRELERILDGRIAADAKLRVARMERAATPSAQAPAPPKRTNFVRRDPWY